MKKKVFFLVLTNFFFLVTTKEFAYIFKQMFKKYLFFLKHQEINYYKIFFYWFQIVLPEWNFGGCENIT